MIAVRPCARLRLMGGFRLTGPGGTAVALVSRRARAIIAYLALAPDCSASRERLCGLLWSDRGEPQARASLRHCLVELREVCGAAGLDLLTIGREQVALIPGTVDSDLGELQAALAGDDAGALAAALGGIGRAPLLEDLAFGGLYRDWLDQSRARTDAVILEGVLAHLARLEAAASWTGSRALADAYLQRDGLDEAVAAAAIRADVALGAATAAHRRFHVLRAGLAAEFGTRPGLAVREALNGRATVSDAAVLPSRSPLLAVLAFDNLSTDRDMDFFSEGVSEEILHTLSRTTNLRVVGRSSSFGFRGAAKAADNVAAQLRATHVLDGSVRRAGDRIRISAHLTDCADQTSLWSSRFDRDLRDAFALQEEVAAAVAQVLKVAFAPSSAARVEPAAYDLYLRARALEVDRDAGPRIALLEQCVALSPQFASAWSALSQALAARARRGPRPRPFPVLKAEATAAAETALRLDPHDGRPHAALSTLRPMGQYREREALLRQALAASPNAPETHTALGAFCNHVGFIEEALGHLRRAYELDPLSATTADVFGAVLYAAGRHQESRALYDIWRGRWPEHMIFTVGPLNAAMCEADWPRFDALAAAARATGSHDPYLGFTLRIGESMRDGDPTLAPRMVERMRRALAETGCPPLDLLTTASVVGLRDAVFAAVDQASYASMFDESGPDPGGGANPGIIFNPGFSRAIMQDIRFVGLCAKLGLCDYWVATDRWPDCAAALAPLYDFQAAARTLAAPRA